MSQGTSQHIATFRDPAGSLRILGENVLRTVHPRYAADSLRFLQSDLARRWTDEGHLVASEVLYSEEDQPLLLCGQRRAIGDWIVEVHTFGCLHPVEVIRRGEDAAVPLLRGNAERLNTAPALDDRVLR